MNRGIAASRGGSREPTDHSPGTALLPGMRGMAPHTTATHARADNAPTPAAGTHDLGEVSRLDFTLPTELEAREPAEARGSGRDDVRLLLGRRRAETVSHHAFCELPELLEPGDLLVVNDSGTLPAALTAEPVGGTSINGGRTLVLHVSTELPDGTWTVEPRLPASDGTTRPLAGVEPANTWLGELIDDVSPRAGTRLRLAGGGLATLRRRHTERLWVASFDIDRDLPGYLQAHGRPIRYSYTDRDWPLTAYQTVFARRPGSAEMPSASRPFTNELVTSLVCAGVRLAPITLHTGVASPEAHEKPYAEHFSVPAATATAIRHAKQDGQRVIAAGTTVVRALESATDADGVTHAADGWTELVVTPRRGVRVVDGLLTGFHEPRASHLLMLAAIAGERLLRRCYEEALAARYLWHEFGDVNLLLP
jgi:S-adenosylmethionine:tRNA ribosyltransferase-isomerase